MQRSEQLSDSINFPDELAHWVRRRQIFVFDISVKQQGVSMSTCTPTAGSR
jgi:hypothetical protein